jgi:hypothetical protein
MILTVVQYQYRDRVVMEVGRETRRGPISEDVSVFSPVSNSTADGDSVPKKSIQWVVTTREETWRVTLIACLL